MFRFLSFRSLMPSLPHDFLSLITQLHTLKIASFPTSPPLFFPFPGAVRSLAEAYTHRETATQVLLSSSKDLSCVNLMCSRVGQGCACRIAQSFDRLAGVKEIDISGNRLPILPDSVWTRPQLEVLIAAKNELTALSLPSMEVMTTTMITKMKNIIPKEEDEVAEKEKSSSSIHTSVPLQHLRKIDLSNNHLTPEAIIPLWRLIISGKIPQLKELHLQGNLDLEKQKQKQKQKEEEEEEGEGEGEGEQRRGSTGSRSSPPSTVTSSSSPSPSHSSIASKGKDTKQIQDEAAAIKEIVRLFPTCLE